MPNTLADRHLRALRAAVREIESDHFRDEVAEAVEWVDAMLSILSCCEHCGTPYAIRNPGCCCEKCDCGRVVDQVPCDTCREDLG